MYTLYPPAGMTECREGKCKKSNNISTLLLRATSDGIGHNGRDSRSHDDGAFVRMRNESVGVIKLTQSHARIAYTDRRPAR